MLRNFYINKEWILSPRARIIYRDAAALNLFLIFVLLPLHRWLDRWPEALIPLVKLMVFAGVLGAAITMVAMEYFLFVFDESSPSKKMLWFCVMLFPLLGSPLYCLVVYSRAAAFGASNTLEARPPL